MASLQRLKERKLVQWAIAYLAGAWVVVEASNLVVERFHWPEVIGQGVIIIALFGFFLTLVLAWYHGEKGRQRVSGSELLIVTVLLVVAGAALTVLPGGEQGPSSYEGVSLAAVDDSRPSVAVLPLDNFSLDTEDAYFASAMHEELTTRISQLSSLFVISRSSVEQYRERATRPSAPEISLALGGVDYLLEGSARIAGDLVRITVKLIDGKTDGHVWSSTFDGRYSVEESIEMQTKIAREIATAVRVEITPEEDDRISALPTESLQAYDLYLLGRHRWAARSADNIRDAIRYYEAAIQKDSAFVLAWVGLADAWTALPWYESVPPREAYSRAKAAAQRALELDDGLAEAHTALGGLAIYHEWDWERAEAHLFRAVELNPNYALARYWLGVAQHLLRRPDQGIPSLQAGVGLNPRGNNFYFTFADVLYNAGRVEDALVAYRIAEKLEPPVGWGLLNMSVALVQQGHTEEAFRVIRQFGQVVGYAKPERLEVVLKAMVTHGLTEQALAVLEDVQSTTGLQSVNLVQLYLNLDAPSMSLRVVRESVAQRHVIVPFMGFRIFGKVSGNAEIIAALQEIGVPVY